MIFLKNRQRVQKKSPITERDRANLEELTLRPKDDLSASFPLGLRQHDLGLDAGAGVNQVVAEEDLRSRSAGSAVLGHVVRTDIHGGCSGLFHELDGSCGSVGTHPLGGRRR